MLITSVAVSIQGMSSDPELRRDVLTACMQLVGQEIDGTIDAGTVNGVVSFGRSEVRPAT